MAWWIKGANTPEWLETQRKVRRITQTSFQQPSNT